MTTLMQKLNNRCLENISKEKWKHVSSDLFFIKMMSDKVFEFGSHKVYPIVR